MAFPRSVLGHLLIFIRITTSAGSDAQGFLGGSLSPSNDSNFPLRDQIQQVHRNLMDTDKPCRIIVENCDSCRTDDTNKCLACSGFGLREVSHDGSKCEYSTVFYAAIIASIACFLCCISVVIACCLGFCRCCGGTTRAKRSQANNVDPPPPTLKGQGGAAPQQAVTDPSLPTVNYATRPIFSQPFPS